MNTEIASIVDHMMGQSNEHRLAAEQAIKKNRAENGESFLQ